MTKKLITFALILALFCFCGVVEAVEPQQYQLDFIKVECEKYELSYTLVYGVIRAESNWDIKADSGSSKGIMQLNKNTYPTLAEDLGIDNFDVYDFEDNVQVGIYKLSLERDYWLEQEYSDEDTFCAMLISYNRGRAGAKRYMAKHGLEADYVDKVMGHKSEYDQSEEGMHSEQNISNRAIN